MIISSEEAKLRRKAGLPVTGPISGIGIRFSFEGFDEYRDSDDYDEDTESTILKVRQVIETTVTSYRYAESAIEIEVQVDTDWRGNYITYLTFGADDDELWFLELDPYATMLQCEVTFFATSPIAHSPGTLTFFDTLPEGAIFCSTQDLTSGRCHLRTATGSLMLEIDPMNGTWREPITSLYSSTSFHSKSLIYYLGMFA